MMALVAPVPVRVQCSWDTQQRFPYNRNVPRKLKSPDSQTAPPAVSLTTASSSPRVEKIDVNQLLKFNPPTPKQGESELSTCLSNGTWLPSAPKVEKPRSSYNAASLAYIGDCIYELYARRHFLAPVLNIDEYNDRVMAVVRCEAQDLLLQKLLNDNILSGNERDILRWGKNTSSAKTRSKKRAGVAVYNRASSLETLIGYLYLTDTKRLDEVMQKLGFLVGASNDSIIKDIDREVQNMKQKKQKHVAK